MARTGAATKRATAEAGLKIIDDYLVVVYSSLVAEERKNEREC
jgi:hypothetical protein